MSSSSTGSLSGSESEDEDPVVAPPTRNEYAGYAALIRNLQRRDRSLGKRLLVRAEDIEGESELGSDGSESSILSSGLEEEWLPPADGEEGHRLTRFTRAARPVRRPEPPSDKRRGKRTYTERSTKDDRWPLQLRKVNQGGPSFDEVIMDIATTQILQEGLELPGASQRPVVSNGTRNHSDESREGSLFEMGNTNDLVIPSTLVDETKVYLNKVLIEIAGLRTMDIGKRRRRMKPMDWEGVMRAAMLAGEPGVVRGVGEALQAALMPESEEISVHQHRLDALERYRQPPISIEALLLPVLFAGPKKRRAHQSDAEIEQRASKRAAKEEIRQAKAEAKALKTRQREDRRAEKKARQQSRLRAIYLANKGSTTPGTEES